LFKTIQSSGFVLSHVCTYISVCLRNTTITCICTITALTESATYFGQRFTDSLV